MVKFHLIEAKAHEQHEGKKTQGHEELTDIHLHLNATSLTVLSGSVAAIFTYFEIFGLFVNLQTRKKKKICHAWKPTIQINSLHTLETQYNK